MQTRSKTKYVPLEQLGLYWVHHYGYEKKAKVTKRGDSHFLQFIDGWSGTATLTEGEFTGLVLKKIS
jgi:hypothetical protein